MTRLQHRLEDLRASGRKALVPFVTAGDPSLAATVPVMHALVEAGADVIELGVPFSDPMADGPVIQRATERALAAGTTLTRVLELAASLRDDVRAPLVLFTYANPVLRMGVPVFAERARQAGIDGVLVLDVPPEEGADAHAAFETEGLDTIFLLSPTTTVERIRRAATLGRGFLYGISRLGVTGAREDVADSAAALAARVRAETDRPLALGFGFSTPEHVRAVGQWADAAVVGSALVTVVAEHAGNPDLGEEVERYVRWLRS
jgi:tryptophan synthase alpha chain